VLEKKWQKEKVAAQSGGTVSGEPEIEKRSSLSRHPQRSSRWQAVLST
jgi:hypothetical protein